MNTAEAVALGIPRWMVLAMPEDVSQITALADLEYITPAQQRAARDWYLRELRRTQWDRSPRRPARRPSALRPSKRAAGWPITLHSSNRDCHCRDWYILKLNSETAPLLRKALEGGAATPGIYRDAAEILAVRAPDKIVGWTEADNKVPQ